VIAHIPLHLDKPIACPLHTNETARQGPVGGLIDVGVAVEARYKGKSRYYPGVISRARSDGTFDVDYDDGEKEMGVAKELIRVAVPADIITSPLRLEAGGSRFPSSTALSEGMRIEARYKGKARYFPGKISRVRMDGTFDVHYDDGEREIGVIADFIRPLDHTLLGSSSRAPDAGAFVEGDKIEALYKGKGTKWFPGVVTRANRDGTLDLRYDDGDSEVGALVSNVRRHPDAPARGVVGSDGFRGAESERFREGSQVEANFKGRGRYYRGVIARARLNNTYDVDYEDGEKESGVEPGMIRLVSAHAGSPSRSSTLRPLDSTTMATTSTSFREGDKIEALYVNTA
jgi:hypothetical protein